MKCITVLFALCFYFVGGQDYYENSLESDTVCYLTKKDGPILQQVTNPVEHGEEPHWDTNEQVLYFVDIHQQKVYRYDPEYDELTSIFIDGGDVTPVIPVRGKQDMFVVGVGRELKLLYWNGENLLAGEHAQTYNLSVVDTDKPKNRFNDGKADKKGRLWIGTMGYEDSNGVEPNQGSLYLITDTQMYNPIKMISPVSISNGLAWSKNNTKFYYIDTPTKKIVSYDFCDVSGTLSNMQVVFDLVENNINAFPDGMTIDSDDNLWIALFNGGSIIKVDPRQRKLLQRIAIPASKVTSCMFGGPGLDVLYVTTSKFGLTAAELAEQPAAGAVFAISNLKGARGLPANTVDVY